MKIQNDLKVKLISDSFSKLGKRFISTKVNTNSKILSIYSNKKNIFKFPSIDQLENNKEKHKHFPPSTIEWSNSVFSYNKYELQSIKNLTIIISKLLKVYFSAIPMLVRQKMYNLKRRLITNKIYISKPKLKHTSSKILITLNFFAENGLFVNKKKKAKNKKLFFNKWIKTKTNLIYFNVDYLLKNIDKKYYKSMIDRIREVQLSLFKTKINNFWLDGILEKDKIKFFQTNHEYLKDWFRKSLIYYNDIVSSISKIIKVIMLRYKLKLKRLDINKLKLRSVISKWFNVLINNYPVKWFGKSLLWEELSNSGNTLKFMIPSRYWKIMSGWSSYSCMVTSQKISEKRMGNHGSKSIFRIVKEQRINGSWHKINFPVLKIYSYKISKNLLSHNPFVKFYKHTFSTYHNPRLIYINQTALELKNIKPKLFNHSKDLSFCLQGQCRYVNNNFNKDNNVILVEKEDFNRKLDPYFVTGFSDAESFFSININKHNKTKLGWQVQLRFGIELHTRDIFLLKKN